MYLLSRDYITTGNEKIIKNVYYDRRKQLIIYDITCFRAWSSTNMIFRTHEPHRTRPANPLLNHMTPIPRKSYPEPELVHRHRVNAVHKRFVREISHEQPLIRKNNTKKVLLGISIGLSIENRDFVRKAKNTFYAASMGLALSIVPIKEVLSQNNYDKDPVGNKPKTEMTYDNKNNKDGLRDAFYGDQVLNSWKHPNVRNTNHSFDFTWDFYGSGDVDGDGDCDMQDYNSFIIGGQNDRADVNGDEQLTNADKQIIYNYVTDAIPYIPGAHYEVSNTNEQTNWITKTKAIDSTEYIWWPGITCSGYATQFMINFAGCEKISESGINFNHIDTTKNGRFNLPVYEVGTVALNGVAHSINAIIVKDTATNFWHYKFIEPQNDNFVQPGDPSMHPDGWANLSRYVYAYSELLEDTLHCSLSTVEFDLNNGIPNLNYSAPDLVEFRPWINPHPYAELPLNYGSECELETNPDISGWPGNMSEDATAYYSDSTNAMQDTLWRKWWIVGEHPVIDSTLGNQVIYELPDVTAPALDWAPQNPLIVNLGNPTSSDVTGIPTFIDNCDGNIPAVQYPDSVYYFGDFSNPQTCDDLKYDIFRPFDATDSSNNVSEEFEHNIKVRDIQAPWWTYQPTGYNLQWTPNWEQDILDNIASNPATAEDNSPLYSVSWAMSGGPGSSGCSQFEFPITTQWDAQDSCQNIANPYIQYINVTENINPVITYMPNDTTINSTQPTNYPNTGGYANGYDNTGEDPLQSREDTDNKGTDPSQADFYNYLIWGNQKLIDACGNFADSVQTITVQDTTKPWFTNFTENIYNNEWSYLLNPITPEGVDDNPEAPTTISINSIDTIYGNSNPNSCEYINDAVIKYYWKATDPSENDSIRVQNYHMQDTEPPQNPQAPGLISYLYGNQIIPTENPTATDNSGIVNYSWEIGNTTQNPDPAVCEHYDYDGEFNWNISDRCDNSVDITSGFNVDKGLTTFYEFFPADITVPEGDTSINITGEPIGKDALNPEILPVVYYYEDELLFQNEFQRGWARNFNLIDVCYQFASDSTQYITEDLDVGISPDLIESGRCKLLVYPNPASDKITILFHGHEFSNCKIIIYNQFGSKILSQVIHNGHHSLNSFELDISILPSGIYLISIISDNINARELFVKISN